MLLPSNALTSPETIEPTPAFVEQVLLASEATGSSRDLTVTNWTEMGCRVILLIVRSERNLFQLVQPPFMTFPSTLTSEYISELDRSIQG